MDAPPVTVTADEVTGLVGTELPPSEWLPITQARVDDFAEAADDRHWVHNDPDAAARGPFGITIGHAHLTLSLLPSLFAQVLRFDDGGASMFYGYNRVRFPAPVPVGGRIRLLAHVVGVQEAGGAIQLTVGCVVEVEGEGRPACVAEAVWRHYPAAGP